MKIQPTTVYRIDGRAALIQNHDSVAVLEPSTKNVFNYAKSSDNAGASSAGPWAFYSEDAKGFLSVRWMATDSLSTADVDG